jgi:hypothetical protein
MLDQVKRWFGGRDVITNLQPESTRVGESLDQEIDAVRQTQLIDPSQLWVAREEAIERSARNSRQLPGRVKNSPQKQIPTKRYRPILRPPMSFLAALDDGAITDAEIHRLRGGKVVIGRHRFAFSLPTPGVSVSESTDEIDAQATQLVDAVDISLPRLVFRKIRHERDRTHSLKSTHLVIGSDSSTCGLPLNDDFVCPNHARIHNTPKGWLIEDLGSQNGVWLRLLEAKLDQNTAFQLGEQRFGFRPAKTR